MAGGCRVLPGFFGIVVQALLFAISVALLVFKKYREGPLRTWYEFGLDSSKQFFGAGWIHTMNLLCAIAFGGLLEKGDECEWYWINIMIDTTLGVYVQYILMQKTMVLLGKTLSGDKAEELRSGYYYNEHGEFQVGWYVKQLALWLILVTAMKAIMVVVMLILCHPMHVVSHFLLGPFMKNAKLKLIVVMIVTPVCMNALQLWIFDNIIKKKSDASGAKEATSPGEIVGLLSEEARQSRRS
eukprot:TRINITY_DN4669_c0_g2_i1.p1 TRINITY_DN4669_c0_g2~~TRINITY_DN4669_c0_g2_i1.p1  ORF type:complete len:279 (+),score=54.86 TRINITY_DN4669_c0_g2_i1:117-839(+)